MFSVYYHLDKFRTTGKLKQTWHEMNMAIQGRLAPVYDVQGAGNGVNSTTHASYNSGTPL